jgi:hypothetical protein
MRCTLALLLLGTLALLAGSAFAADDTKAEFFNGKDFTGWEGLTDKFWTIKDKALIGSTFPNGNSYNTFLCSKEKFKDFEMKFQVCMIGSGWGGNSGIQIRSKIHDMKNFAVTGPQCDMGDGYWGSLYGENFGGMMKEAPSDKVNKVLKKNGYNDYYIKCVGKHVTIKVNDVVTVDEDFDKMPEEGIIAFQLHGGGPMLVAFKNIQFKDLTAKK